jgi:hypothetical protein
VRYDRKAMGDSNRGDLKIIRTNRRARTLEFGANSTKLTRRPAIKRHGMKMLKQVL